MPTVDEIDAVIFHPLITGGTAMPKITPAPLTRSLGAIAQEIADDYRTKGKPVYFAAVPYVEALAGMRNFDSKIGYDSAEDIVIRLLGNLTTWRGETAVRVKAELRAALADHQAGRRR